MQDPLSNRIQQANAPFSNPRAPQDRQSLRLSMRTAFDLTRSHSERFKAFERALELVPDAPDLCARATSCAPEAKRSGLALTAAQGFERLGDNERATHWYLRSAELSSEEAPKARAAQALKRLERPGLSARARGAAVLIEAFPPAEGAVDCDRDVLRFSHYALQGLPARVRCQQLGADLLLDVLPGGRLRKHILALPHDEKPEVCALFEGRWLIVNPSPSPGSEVARLNPETILELGADLEHSEGPLVQALEALEVAVFQEHDNRREADFPRAARRNLPVWITRATHACERLFGDTFPWQRYGAWLLTQNPPLMRLFNIWEQLDERPRDLGLDAEDAYADEGRLVERLSVPHPSNHFVSSKPSC